MPKNKTEIQTGYTYRPSANMIPIVELGWNEIDLIDMVIYQEIINMHSYDKIEKVYNTGEEWIWVSHLYLTKRLPYIGIGSKNGIKKRIYKLIKRGMISQRQPKKGDQKSYYSKTRFHQYYMNEISLSQFERGCDESSDVPCDESSDVPCDENVTNDISKSNDVSKNKDSTSTETNTNFSSPKQEGNNTELEVYTEKEKVRKIVGRNINKKRNDKINRRDYVRGLLPEGMDTPQAIEKFVHYFVVQKQMSSKYENGVMASFDKYMERIESDWTLKKDGDQKASVSTSSIGSKSEHLVNIYSKIVGKELLEKELRCFNEMMADGITDVVFAALCVNYKSLQDEEANATKMKEWYEKYGGNNIEKNFNWKDDVVQARKMLDKIK